MMTPTMQCTDVLMGNLQLLETLRGLKLRNQSLINDVAFSEQLLDEYRRVRQQELLELEVAICDLSTQATGATAADIAGRRTTADHALETLMNVRAANEESQRLETLTFRLEEVVRTLRMQQR